MKHFNYDLIVIGAGSGGISSAILAKNLGKKVALIEKRKIGGKAGSINWKKRETQSHTSQRYF